MMHCWIRPYTKDGKMMNFIAGYHEDDGWIVLSSYKVPNGWTGPQLLKQHFETESEAKTFVETSAKDLGYEVAGDWQKEPMDGPFEG